MEEPTSLCIHVPIDKSGENYFQADHRGHTCVCMSASCVSTHLQVCMCVCTSNFAVSISCPTALPKAINPSEGRKLVTKETKEETDRALLTHLRPAELT